MGKISEMSEEDRNEGAKLDSIDVAARYATIAKESTIDQ